MPEDTRQQFEKWQRLLVIASTLLVLMLLVAGLIRVGLYIHHTLLLFSLSALLAYALDPLVEGIRRLPGKRSPRDAHSVAPEDGNTAQGLRFAPRRAPIQLMPRGMAIFVVFTVLLGLIGFGIYGLSRPLASQVKSLSDKRQLQAYKQRADIFLQHTDTRLDGMGVHSHFDDYLRDPSTIPDSVKAGAVGAEQLAVPVLRAFAVSLGEAVFVLLITVYFLVYSHEMRRRLNDHLPAKLLRHAEIWEEDVNRILGGFVRGQLIIALVMGASTALGCLALGIHIWLLIGIFVAFASLIPVFGPYLGGIPAIIAAIIGPTHLHSPVAAAIAVAALFVIINEAGSKILYPRLVGHAIGLHSVLVLFVIIAGLEIDGITGVLFAAPLTAIGIVTLVHLYRFWLDLPDSLLSVRSAGAAIHNRRVGDAGNPSVTS